MTEKKTQEAPLLEWIVGGAGAAVFWGLVAILLVNGARDDRTPPDVTVRVERIVDLEHGHVVEFSALNRGDVAAAGLRLVAELRATDGRVERRETELDYLPPHSRRGGGFMFEGDPAAGVLTIVPEAYADP